MNLDRLASPLRRRALYIISPIVLTTLGFWLAFAIRFDLAIPGEQLRRFAQLLPYLLLVRVVLWYRFRLNKGYWHHVGVRDLLRLTIAGSVGSLLLPAVLFVTGQLHGIVPASVFVLEWMLWVALNAGARIIARVVRERLYFVPTALGGRRTFIVGAGEAGEQLLRQILHDSRRTLEVVGLIDDDPAKRGESLHGVDVLGGADELRRLVTLRSASLALIAIPTATPEQLARLVDRCVEAGLEVKTLPPMQNLVTEEGTRGVNVSQVRDVQIEDLLGREPVKLDVEGIGPYIRGKVVMVTGAGGSIGSELARQVVMFGPSRLILVERAESPLYFIQLECARANPEVEVVPILASITNADRMEMVFERFKPDAVFHAAAYKHVPMLEANVVEGVWNNVIGTLRLARAAANAGTGRFVLISTDKAVNPTSILGITKLIGERIVLELPSLCASGTDFRVVRFGNVLGSDGSVVPLFKRQLAVGGPLTVTHPDVRRYFMTIPEAVQLVLQAAMLPEAARRISLLEMGTQIRIVDLAEQLIRLAGLVPHKDIQIVYTGLRPGEKLREELIAPGETALPTSLDKVRIVDRPGRSGVLLAQRLRQLARVTAQRDAQAIRRTLMGLMHDPTTALEGVTSNVHANGNGNGHGNGNGNGKHKSARRAAPAAREPRSRIDVTEAAISPRRTGTNGRA